MKSNFKFFLIFILFCTTSFADQFKFETSKIELVDNGDLLYATDGIARSIDKNLEIEANKFEYNKKQKILKAFNGMAYFKSNNIQIEFDEIILDQSNSITSAKKNVKIIDLKKKISVETDFVTFNEKDNTLESTTPSVLKDSNDNILKTDNFFYDLNKRILKLKNINLKDIDNNIYNIKFAFVDTNLNKLIGNDLEINFDNKSFSKNNEPRIKGKTIILEKDMSEISKGVFTTCKKRDGCPPWQLSAKKIEHNKKKQIINYENALLRVYNVPVMYFPKFFHPDPTVKRKSGFLVPTLKNSPNSNNYLTVPYFFAVSQNKDFTFSPRFYSDDKFLLQTEFRQKNEKSNHIADVGIFNEKNENSKSHFFYNFNRLIDFAKFDESELNFKVEKTSNDTYLKGNKLISSVINSYSVLENQIGLNLYSPNLSVSSEIKVYEDLDKNSHDRYEFIFPKLDLVKQIENKTNFDGSFELRSENFVRSYSTNIFEKININNFIFNSSPKITSYGFYNNYDFIIKNVNSDTQNSDTYKEDENFYLSGIFQYNSSLPLVKETDNFLNIIKPKIALKLSPNTTKDISKTEGNRLDVDNIYDIDRLSLNDTVEGGASLTFGTDFTISDQIKSKEIFGLKLANNFRFEENDDLPRNNQLGAKTSNFFGEILFSPNEIITTKYNASAKNNLTDINYENLIAEISLNNFVTTFDYLNENNDFSESSYLSNTTKYLINDSNSIGFSTRENNSSNLTEYYNLIYEYKNDCLSASIEYNKDYYDDRDIKPEENIFFKLTIIPFGEASSPNLNN